MKKTEIKDLLGIMEIDWDKFSDLETLYVSKPSEWDMEYALSCNEIITNLNFIQTEYSWKLKELMFLMEDKIYILKNKLFQNNNILTFEELTEVYSEIAKTQECIDNKAPESEIESFSVIMEMNKTQREKYISHVVNKFLTGYIDTKIHPKLIDKKRSVGTLPVIYNIRDLDKYIENTITLKFHLINMLNMYNNVNKKM